MNVVLISMQDNLNVIGLRYIHYYLLNNNHRSFLLFLPKLKSKDVSYENIRDFISKAKPGLIGFSLMSREFYLVRDLTLFIKREFPQIPVVWGGIHPSMASKMCLEYTDYVCVGEGERTILDLANFIESGKNPKEINNLCYLENGIMKSNNLYPFIEDLDSLPICEHIPKDSFIMHKDRVFSLGSKLLRKFDQHFGLIYHIMSSRGCPFSCTYCCNNFFLRLYKTKKVRTRSASSIILELKKAISTNPDIEWVSFQDDCFLAYNEEYIKEFSSVYKKIINKPFIIRAIPIYVSEAKISYLKKAGLSWAFLGLQSGSDQVCREIYKRSSFKSDFLRATNLLNKYKIATFCDVIADNPFESDEDRLETVKALIETPKPIFPKLFSMVFFQGTEIFEKASQEFPETVNNFLNKDFMVYKKDVINSLIRLSAFLNKTYMESLIFSYKVDPKGMVFKTKLFIGRILSLFIFEPLTYFQIAVLSNNGSYKGVIKNFYRNLQPGLVRYFNQFKDQKY